MKTLLSGLYDVCHDCFCLMWKRHLDICYQIVSPNYSKHVTMSTPQKVRKT